MGAAPLRLDPGASKESLDVRAMTCGVPQAVEQAKAQAELERKLFDAQSAANAKAADSQRNLLRQSATQLVVVRSSLLVYALAFTCRVGRPEW